MDIYELREKLKLGLNGVILDTGDHLNSVLTPDQINDIAGTLTHYLPTTLQVKMTNLHSEVLSNIRNEATVERLHGNASDIILPSDTVKDMKHKVFILLYTLFLLGENIDDTFTELFSFYQSFLIDKLDLRNEVAEHFVHAVTVFINDNECVRVNSLGKLVPTTKTFKQFKNLL